MILIDTTPLVALCNGRDAYHDKATRELDLLMAQPLCTCEAVLVETTFHLSHSAQRARLNQLLNELNVVSIPQQEAHHFRQQIFDWLAKYADQSPDWADACIAVLSGQDKKLKVWTYDTEFRSLWRRPDGSAIPMAVK